jgi:hypothetical protein
MEDSLRLGTVRKYCTSHSPEYREILLGEREILADDMHGKNT